jgi:putative beta-barrel porin BBP2
MRREGFVLVLALPAMAVSAAAAEPRRRAGRIRLGPFQVSPKLELRNLGVDTNVFNTRTHPVRDTSAVLRPSAVAVAGIGRRLRLEVDGYLDLNYFRRRRSERSIDFGGEARADLALGRATLFAGAGGLQARQRFSIDLDPRLLRQEKWRTLGARFELTRRVSASVSGTSRTFSSERLVVDGQDVSESLDRNSLIGGVQARYAITRRTSLLTSAEVIEDRFPEQAFGVSRLARSFRYLAGVELGRRALLRGRILGGLREFAGAATSAAPAYRGPVLSMSADLPVAGRARLTGIAERDVYYAAIGIRTQTEQLRNAYVLKRYAGSAFVILPLDLIGQASFSWEGARYVRPVAGGIRADHLWSAGAGLFRRAGRSARVGAAVAWSRRVSNVPGFSYEGLRYGLQAEIVP